MTENPAASSRHSHRLMKNVRRSVHILFFIIFRPLIYIVPFSLYLEFIKRLTSLAAPFYFRRKRIAKRNLLCLQEFSPLKIATVLNDGIKNVPLFGFLDFCIDKWSLERCKRHVIIEGKEDFMEAVAQKRGVLLAFVHSNITDVAIPCVGHLEKVYAIVLLDSDGSFVSNIHVRMREHLWESIKTISFRYLDKEKAPTVKIRGMLNQAKVVAVAADGRHSGKFITVPFFSKKIRLPSGIFRLSALVQSPVVPLFSSFDREKGVFRVWLGKPILSPSPEETAEAYALQFQEHLREYPSHWTGWWRMRLIRDEKGEEVFYIHSA
jgi:lauroyl/myristoyl acyltransferase